MGFQCFFFYLLHIFYLLKALVEVFHCVLIIVFQGTNGEPGTPGQTGPNVSIQLFSFRVQLLIEIVQQSFKDDIIH